MLPFLLHLPTEKIFTKSFRNKPAAARFPHSDPHGISRCPTIYKCHSRSEYRLFSPFRGRCRRKARSAGGRGGQLHSRSEYRLFSPFRGRCRRKARSAGGRGGQLHSRSEYRFFSPFRGRCRRKARREAGRGGQIHSRSEYRFFSPPRGSQRGLLLGSLAPRGIALPLKKTKRRHHV
jgi:hypothetical protein